MSLPHSVRIVEVGPRDGLQNEKNTLSAKQRIDFIGELIECGLTHIEAGSFVHPKWVPQMANTADVLQQLPVNSDVGFPVLVPNLRGLDDAKNAGAQEIAVFAAATETFSHKNINCSIEQSFERFSAVIHQALQSNIKIRGYISCVMGCPYEGAVDPEKVHEIAGKLIDLGCYEISLGDTIGTGTPRQTEKLITLLANDIDIKQLAIHFHDTYGQALTNIYVALQLGVRVIDSSVSGLGGCPYAKGASGNVATEDVIHMLNGLDIQHHIDLDRLITTGRQICEQLDRPVMSKVNLAKP